MPSTLLPKTEIREGYSPGESGWGDELNESLLRLDATAFGQWSQRRATTINLSYGYHGGQTSTAAGTSLIANGTILLAASQTNYIERDYAGTVSTNTTGFTQGRIPMAVAVTGGADIVSVSDQRLFDAVACGGYVNLRGAPVRLINRSGTGSIIFRNNADSADNLTISDAGVLTTRGGFIIAAGGFTVTLGDMLISAGVLVFGAAASSIVPGATSFSFRNSANNADNLFISDAGAVATRLGFTANSGNIVAGSGNFVTGTSILTPAYLSLGTSPAGTGTIRLANGTSIVARNAANSADVPILAMSVGNDVQVGGIGSSGLRFIAGGFARWFIDGTTPDLLPLTSATYSLGSTSQKVLTGFFSKNVKAGATYLDNNDGIEGTTASGGITGSFGHADGVNTPRLQMLVTAGLPNLLEVRAVSGVGDNELALTVMGVNGLINFVVNGTKMWQVTKVGALIAVTDGSVDIGGSGSGRPRTVSVKDYFDGYGIGSSGVVMKAAGVQLLKTETNYHSIARRDGVPGIFLGGTGDKTNYYDNDSHIWRDAASNPSVTLFSTINTLQLGSVSALVAAVNLLAGGASGVAELNLTATTSSVNWSQSGAASNFGNWRTVVAGGHWILETMTDVGGVGVKVMDVKRHVAGATAIDEVRFGTHLQVLTNNTFDVGETATHIRAVYGEQQLVFNSLFLNGSTSTGLTCTPVVPRHEHTITSGVSVTVSAPAAPAAANTLFVLRITNGTVGSITLGFNAVYKGSTLHPLPTTLAAGTEVALLFYGPTSGSYVLL